MQIEIFLMAEDDHHRYHHHHHHPPSLSHFTQVRMHSILHSAHMIGSLSDIKGKCWEFVLLSMTFGGRLPVGRHSGRGLPWPRPGKKLLVRMWHEKAERGGGMARRAQVPNELRENSWDFILIRKSILDSGISVWMWGNDLEIRRSHLYIDSGDGLSGSPWHWTGDSVWTGLDNTQTQDKGL